jgi:NAD/NADP transhydrogenase alpha subunit
VKLGGKLHSEAGAGLAIGLSDADFADMVNMTDRTQLVEDADVVLCVKAQSRRPWDRGAVWRTAFPRSFRRSISGQS